MLRMKDGSIEKELLNEMPRETWMKQVEEYLREIKVGNWRQIALDRKKLEGRSPIVLKFDFLSFKHKLIKLNNGKKFNNRRHHVCSEPPIN